jgi:hypothetical protein
MPKYVITTHEIAASLEEARRAAYDRAAAANRYGGAEDAAYEIPADGGRIGPMADGTIIEVRPA